MLDLTYEELTEAVNGGLIEFFSAPVKRRFTADAIKSYKRAAGSR